MLYILRLSNAFRTLIVVASIVALVTCTTRTYTLRLPSFADVSLEFRQLFDRSGNNANRFYNMSDKRNFPIIFFLHTNLNHRNYKMFSK